MKTKKSIYLSLFFSFCIIASLVVNTLQNLNTPVLKSNFISYKHILFTDKEQTSANNEFLFEENETESETSHDFKLWTSLLSDIASYLQLETTNKVFYSSCPIAEKSTNPIYMLVCDFRI